MERGKWFDLVSSVAHAAQGDREEGSAAGKAAHPVSENNMIITSGGHMDTTGRRG